MTTTQQHETSSTDRYAASRASTARPLAAVFAYICDELAARESGMWL